MSKNYQEINFQEISLRGHSFKGRDLENANFYQKDIRGADFSGANLTNANFKGAKMNGTNFSEANLTNAILDEAKCGITIWWTIFILIISLFIMSLSGFTASIVISCNFYFFSPIRGVIKNIYTILISVVYIAWLHAIYLPAFLSIDQTSLIIIGVSFIVVVGILIPFIETMNESEKEHILMFIIIAFSSLFVIIINFILIIYLPQHPVLRRAIGAFFGSCLGIVISGEAIIKKDKIYVWIWNLFVHFISAQGTKFHGSNLNDASLVNANLKGSSFLECTVIRTNWEDVKKIDCSKIKVNYLDNSKIRCLLINKQVGKDKNYQGMNLQGLNFANANLNMINLSKADLSDSKLIEVQLQESILSSTRLDNVDLSGANITGAKIEIRSIPATAQLDGLICNFFDPHSNLKQRYPKNQNKNLTSEEAIQVLQKPSEINLIFKEDGIDWQAFLQGFKNCLEEFDISPDNSDNLIQAFERELNGDFVIRLNVPDNVDKVEFELKLIQAYKKSIEVLKRKYRNTLKTTEIDFQENTSMLKITEQLANPGNHIIQNIITIGNNSMLQPNNGDINMTNNPGGLSVGGSVSGDIRNLQGDNNRAVQGDNNQGVLGDGNQVTQQNKVGADTGESLTKEDVVKLLAQLETLIQGAELPADTKEEVIEDLSAAKKATDKEEPNKQRALERLGTVAETLDKTSKGVEAGQKIWTTAKPIIVKVATWLGAAAGSQLLGL
ncbi:pentapeptide repeat-containing protein [Nostoc sp.]|uniref:pentapeptide repeat-containing protein n=1 Tax=Nostoc sp. TaxID=1180 RepID=UPI002FFA317B